MALSVQALAVTMNESNLNVTVHSLTFNAVSVTHFFTWHTTVLSAVQRMCYRGPA